ncbi:MAG: HlyD family efflux transporter periplasmic adaptor subunit, partial [Pseudomonadota bacterium]
DTRCDSNQCGEGSFEEALDQARFSRDALAARIDETDALIETTRVRLDKAVIRAPYSGQVAARSADSGSTLGAGQTVVQLMEDGAAQLRVGLPLWLAADAGDRFEAEIAGRRFTATLSALRPDVDPATRTRTALLDVEGTDAPFGATATLVVPRTVEARGAWAPIEALREGAPGVWSVLVVDGEGIVRAAPVEVLHAEADRVFLAGGLSNGLSLVSGGPHRVVPGQHVALTDAATSAEN